MRARTVTRAMEAVGGATGLPGSGQSGTEADDLEAWGEMEDEEEIKLLTPDPQIPDTGEPAVLGYWPCTKGTTERTRIGV